MNPSHPQLSFLEMWHGVETPVTHECASSLISSECVYSPRRPHKILGALAPDRNAGRASQDSQRFATDCWSDTSKTQCSVFSKTVGSEV